jgi:hypothetical protein
MEFRTDLTALVDRLGGELIETDHDGDGAELRVPDNVEFHVRLRYDERRRSHILFVDGKTLKDSRGHSYHSANPITIAMSKTVERVASEIENRFLTDYAPRWHETVGKRDRGNGQYFTELALFDRFKTELNLPQSAVVNGDKLALWFQKSCFPFNGWVRFELEWTGTAHVELDIPDAMLDAFLEFLRFYRLAPTAQVEADDEV